MQYTLSNLQKDISRAPDWAWLILFFLTALTIRLFNIDTPSLRFDEVITLDKSKLDWIDLLRSPTDNKPPLYYLLVKPILYFGESETILRLPSAIIGSLLVAISYYLGRELSNSMGRFILPGILLISDIGIILDQDARHYSLLSLGLIVMLIGVFRLLKNADTSSRLTIYFSSNKGAFLLTIGGTVLCLYTHPLSLLYLAPVLASVIIYAISTGRYRPLLPSLLAVTLVSILLWTPWLIVLLNLISADTTYQLIEQISITNAVRTVIGFLGVHHIWRLGIIPEVFFLLATTTGLWFIYRRVNAGISLVICFGIILTPALVWITGVVLQPIFTQRYLMPLHIYFAIAITGFLVFIPNRIARISATLIVFLLIARSTQAYLMINETYKEQWRQSIAFIEQQQNSKDIVFICNPYFYKVIDYYMNKPLLSVLSNFNNKLVLVDKNSANQALRDYWLGLDIHYKQVDATTGDLDNIGNVYLIQRPSSCNDNVENLLEQSGQVVESNKRIAKFRNIDVYKIIIH